jgi:acyl dehydratase
MTNSEFSWSTSAPQGRVHPREAHTWVGRQLFCTEWRRVDREHLDQFHWSVDEVATAADMTANQEFPRGDDNVDGFMLMSLCTSAFFNNFPFGGNGVVAYNYGIDRLRFPATVYLENRIRLHATLTSASEKSGGHLLNVAVVMEMEKSERPAMTADWLVFLTSTH